jgi:hypothetical protein
MTSIQHLDLPIDVLPVKCQGWRYAGNIRKQLVFITISFRKLTEDRNMKVLEPFDSYIPKMSMIKSMGSNLEEIISPPEKK